VPRVQQETLGTAAARANRSTGSENLIRAGAEKLTVRQWTRFHTAVVDHEDHL